MDFIDLDDEFNQKVLDLQIAHARSPLIMPEGCCLNCDEELDNPRQRFCDHECAADWQNRTTVQRRQRGG